MADIPALTDEFHIELEFRCESEPDGGFHVTDFTLTEALSETYRAEVELHAENAPSPPRMLGRNATLIIRRGGAERLVRGVVTRVEHGGVSGSGPDTVMIVRVSLEPALCALKHTRDSRIFQNANVVTILREVLTDALNIYRRELDVSKLRTDYPLREYTVQYDESDYDFVSRLAAQEGITFYFDHQGDFEKLIFADDKADFITFRTIDGGPVQMSETDDEDPGTERVHGFCREDSLGSTSSVMRDYDWTRPDNELRAETLAPDAQSRERTVHASTGETTIGGYDEGATTYTEVDILARATVLQQRLRMQDVTFAGDGAVTGFMPGIKITLARHGIRTLDGDYVITSVTHAGGTSASRETGADRYRNHFTAIPADVPYRPTPTVPWPRIHSVQTARVVGLPVDGAEITTDEHGRVKVQFQWDRHGARDDRSSCFIRVAQQWAGKGYGFLFIPRIGHEVLVSFIEGNPDRPVIIGSVYNGENRTENHPLPASETRSVIRTKTFGKDGSEHYNELSFNDAPDNEEVLIHASRDFNETVVKDHSTKVDGKQSNTIKLSHSESVGGSQSLSVGGNRSHDVKGTEDITVKKDRTVTVTEGGETRTIKGPVVETFQNTRTTTVTGADDETCESTKKVTVTGTTSLISKGAVKIAQNETSVLTLAGSFDLSTPGKINATNGKTTITGDAGKLSITSESEITVTCGGASITLKSDGTIVVSGKDVSLKGQTTVELGVGSSVLKVEAAGVTVSGPKISSAAVGIHEINGAVIKIG